MPDHDRETTIHCPPVDVRSEAFADLMAEYPFPHEVERFEDLPQTVLTAADEGDPFTARVIGYGSSYRESHLNHTPGTAPPKGVRCSGCRWTDTAILAADDGHYVFVSLGKSAIPREWQRDTIVWTRDATEVLRKCFVPTKAGFSRDKGAKAIPPHNADAFRQAASINDEFASLLEQYADAIPEVTASESDPLAGL